MSEAKSAENAGFNPYLLDRLEGLKNQLIANFQAGGKLPSVVKGQEREIFVKHFLGEVFPPVYRLGTGVITDIAAKLSRQIDVVIEVPLAPSYPATSEGPRLYLADSVAIAIEVKSDLKKGKKDIMEVTSSIRQLSRIPNLASSLLQEDSGVPQIEPTKNIPVYAVGYLGPSSISDLSRFRQSMPVQTRPDGLFVISTGCFKGVHYASCGLRGYNLFIGEISEQLNGILGIGFPNFAGYSQAFTTDV